MATGCVRRDPPHPGDLKMTGNSTSRRVELSTSVSPALRRFVETLRVDKNPARFPHLPTTAAGAERRLLSIEPYRDVWPAEMIACYEACFADRSSV
jgi:hypothetical protein